jgi:hypothetical protein
MKWQLASRKIAVSRFNRLKEWPWRFILEVGASADLNRNKRYTRTSGVPFFFMIMAASF